MEKRRDFYGDEGSYRGLLVYDAV